MTNHRQLLTLLLPPTSYAPNGERLQAELVGEGNALDNAQVSARRSLNGVTPFYADQLLSDWERVCALVPPPGATYQFRLQAVLAKLAEIGGLSIPYFIRLAASLGYQISIEEPQPFRAGVNRAGDRLAPQEIIWVWHVNIQDGTTRIYQFRAGLSVAGERLSSFGDPVLEAVLNDLKPAHTLIQYTYKES